MSGWTSGHPVTLRLLRWVLLGIFAVGVVVGVTLGGAPNRSSLIVVDFAAYALIGNLIAARQPRNPIGWLFLTIGALTGLAGWSNAGIKRAVESGDLHAWYGVLGAWVNAWFWYPLIASATVLTLFLFPNGLPSPRWRPALWLAAGATTAMTVTAALAPTLVMGDSSQAAPSIDNPLNPGFGQAAGQVVFVVATLAVLASGLVALFGAVVRTKRASGVERLQMRWFAFSSAVLIVWVVLFGSGFLSNGDSILYEVFFTAVLSLIPLSCGVAITRYRLYDIDRIISRTTSYAAVTGMLLATYVLVVTLVSRLLPSTSSLGVAAATLSAAALARPLLRRVQAGVDRRFDRARYDGRRTVDEFGRRLRREVDVSVVSDDLVSAVIGALAPAQVTLWLRQQQ